MVSIETLADFKRFLREPGATVQIIRNDWTDPAKTMHPLTPKAGYFDAKQVRQVRSNAVEFTTGGWLTFPKAAHFRAAGDVIEIDMNQDGQFRHVLAYRLSFKEDEGGN